MRIWNHFVLYYGVGETERMAQYDLAIVDPQRQTPEAVQCLRAHGTSVLARLNCREVCAVNPEYGRLREEDFWLLDGQRVCNPVWQSECVRLDSERWQEVLLDNVECLLRAGYEGIFLDALAKPQGVSVPPQEQVTYWAVRLLHKMRERFPQMLLIQNNGLSLFYHYTAPLLTGLCLENPPVVSRPVWDMLQELRERDGANVLLLTSGKSSPVIICKVRRFAKQFHYPYYHAENGYTVLH